MKNSLALIVLLSILWSCQEKEKKQKVPYKQGDMYELNGKKYLIKTADYYLDGTDKFLTLDIDTLNTKYEIFVGLHENGKKKKIALVNPKVDTLLYPRKYNDKKSPAYYMFIGYILKEETFHENGKMRSWAIRSNIMSDSLFNFISYDENGKIKRKTKNRKVNDVWIIEAEKDGKTTIDTSYFWK
ncbi:hypothetical protein AD998_08640 [bacterium 336/3]|nr:hypothetical protein AD998_08640 [bacterium 336/3]